VFQSETVRFLVDDHALQRDDSCDVSIEPKCKDEVMNVTVVELASGCRIEAPADSLMRFCREEYAYYDAIPSGHPDRIEPLDVLATVSINSFVTTAEKVRGVHRGLSEACEPLLAEIPADASLSEPGLTLDPVRRLLQARYKRTVC
jgi:hypothetical protein